MKAFTPSHTGHSPPLPIRSGWGVTDFTGIPHLSEAARDEANYPLFDSDDDFRADEMAAICKALKQRMAEKCGGTWSEDYR